MKLFGHRRTARLEEAGKETADSLQPDDGEDTVRLDTTPAADDERTVRLTRRRFARRQWTRRWLAWRRVVLATLLVLVLAGSVWLVFFSSVLAVSGVQVVGTRVLSADVVRQAAAVPNGTPLATADLGSVTARVSRLPAVQSVDVSRSWPDKVRIAVTERRAVAVVEPAQPGGTLRGVDVHGKVFRTFATRPAHLPVIRTAGHTGPDALAEAAEVAGSLPPQLADKVAYVRVRTVDTITLLLHNGHAVRWGSADSSHVKARVLAVLLGQHAAYYDVSVPGQPVIRK
jgi:cell division protein FtsQ